MQMYQDHRWALTTHSQWYLLVWSPARSRASLSSWDSIKWDWDSRRSSPPIPSSPPTEGIQAPLRHQAGQSKGSLWLATVLPGCHSKVCMFPRYLERRARAYRIEPPNSGNDWLPCARQSKSSGQLLGRGTAHLMCSDSLLEKLGNYLLASNIFIKNAFKLWSSAKERPVIHERLAPDCWLDYFTSLC